ELELRADAVRPEGEADACPLEKLLDAAPDRALQLPRVRALEADRHVRDRRDAVEVDEHGNQPFARLAVPERLRQQARLPVLARRVQPHVMAADGALEKPPALVLAIDHVLRGQWVRIDEGIDVFDHQMSVRLPDGSLPDERGTPR